MNVTFFFSKCLEQNPTENLSDSIGRGSPVDISIKMRFIHGISCFLGLPSKLRKDEIRSKFSKTLKILSKSLIRIRATSSKM